MNSTLLRSLVFASLLTSGPLAAGKPNIIYILTDDVGYGDVGCYGATHVKTPNIDRLAKEGLRFTDAHSTASVCTPTRYAFMTGRYAWRQPGTGIAAGNAPLLIKPGTTTVASLLKSAGYRTGVVGKWHLGLGDAEKTDYNRELKPGPLELGFDYAFIIPATGDRVPCVFVENHRVVGYDPADPIQVSYGVKIGDEPTGGDPDVKLKIQGGPGHKDTVVNGIPRIGFMTGGKAARWVDEDIADTLAAKAVKFIEANQAGPFFLYFTPHDIHEPMVPHPRFRGTSDCGWRGDVIHELDWTVGEVLAALDRLKLTAEHARDLHQRQRRRDQEHLRRRHQSAARSPEAERRVARFQGLASTKAVTAYRSSRAGRAGFRRAAIPGNSSATWTPWRPLPRSPDRSCRRMPALTASMCFPRCSVRKVPRAASIWCCRTTVRRRWPCERGIGCSSAHAAANSREARRRRRKPIRGRVNSTILRLI